MTSIQIVEGVTGGFMPASPRRTIIIETDPPRIQQYLKSSAALAIDGYAQTEKIMDFDILSDFVGELIHVFTSLPVEDPVGGCDIYGLDTTIIIESPGFRWQNIPNQGCGIQESKVKPTQAQQAKFKSVVDRVYQFADSNCTDSFK